MTSVSASAPGRLKGIIATGAAVLVTWIAFGAHREVPGLDQFDLAIHETGHLIAAFLPRLVMFMAGSVAQVAFPLAMALYFGVRRRDAAGAGFCLAWAGTSARDASIYAGDAVRQALPLIGGGEHDWAYILGPRGFDALGRTSAVAKGIEVFGLALAVIGIVVAAGALIGTFQSARTETALPVGDLSDRDAWAAASSLPFRYERDAG